MTFTSTNEQCNHGYIGFCPYGCFQQEDDLVALMQDVIKKHPTTEEQLIHILTYKQAEARQLTFELGEVIQEIRRLEDKLEKVRRKNKPD